jgi:hypothetical protein
MRFLFQFFSFFTVLWIVCLSCFVNYKIRNIKKDSPVEEVIENKQFLIFNIFSWCSSLMLSTLLLGTNHIQVQTIANRFHFTSSDRILRNLLSISGSISHDVVVCYCSNIFLYYFLAICDFPTNTFKKEKIYCGKINTQFHSESKP